MKKKSEKKIKTRQKNEEVTKIRITKREDKKCDKI